MIFLGLTRLYAFSASKRPGGKVSFLYNSRSKGLLSFRQMCLPKLSRTVSEFCDLRPNPMCLLSTHAFHSLSSDSSLRTTQPRSTLPDPL